MTSSSIRSAEVGDGLVDVGRATFVVGTLVLAAAGQRGALNLAAGAAIVFAVRPLKLPRRYDLSVVLAAALLSWGNALDLYGRVINYDTFVHLMTQFLIAPTAYIVLARLGVVPGTGDMAPRDLPRAIALITLALGLSMGALWEITEWSLDAGLGTSLVHGEADTATDLLADALGAAIGGIRLAAWSVAQPDREPLSRERLSI